MEDGKVWIKLNVVSMTSKALIIVGHGSHTDPKSDQPIFDNADRIRKRNIFNEVRETFWKEEPSLREVIRTLRSEKIYIVPLFISKGYFVENVIPRELRLVNEYKKIVDKEIHYTHPIGTHKDITELLIKKVKNKTQDKNIGIAVVGHGTERNSNSSRTIYYHVERIKNNTGFNEVKPFFLDEKPYVDNLIDSFKNNKIAIIPAFISDGPHTRKDIPERIGINDEKQKINGKELFYLDSIGNHKEITDIIIKRVKESGEKITKTKSKKYNNKIKSDKKSNISLKTYIIDKFIEKTKNKPIDFDGLKSFKDSSGFNLKTSNKEKIGLTKKQLYNIEYKFYVFINNWYQWKIKNRHNTEHQNRFLLWVEKKDKLTPYKRYKNKTIERNWGELTIKTKLKNNGERNYLVLHQENRDDSISELTQYTDPLDSRYIAKFDENNKYRPLKTAKSLKTGWVFTELKSDQLLKVIDFIYPSSIENWSLQCKGELDITNFTETVERQTGLYSKLDQINSNTLNHLTDELCSKRCIKEKKWDVINNKKQGSKDNNKIPCREPCSVFLEEARKQIKNGRETDNNQKTSNLEVVSIV